MNARWKHSVELVGIGILVLLFPFSWNRCSPNLTGEIEQILLTEVRPEDALPLEPGIQQAERIGARGTGTRTTIALAADVSGAGRYSIYGISSASESWPLRLRMNGKVVSTTAFFQRTGSMREHFEEHRIATGVELRNGRNLLSLTGREIESRTLILGLRREGPLAFGRGIGLAAIALLALATRRIGLRWLPRSAGVRLTLTACLSIVLLAGLALVLWRGDGENLTQLGYSAEGRLLRVQRLQALEVDLASRRQSGRPAAAVEVLVLGDSTHVYPHPPEGGMIPTLQRLVPEAKREQIAFFGIGAGGLDAQDHYLLLNRLASERPDLVIIPVNLRFFGSSPFAAPRFRLFDGYLRPSELRSLRGLDLEISHVVLRWADDLLFESRMGPFVQGLDVWFEREQGRLLADFATWVEPRAVVKKAQPAKPASMWKRTVEVDHPLLDVFRRISGFAARQGIRVLYYAAPMNEAAQRRRGIAIRMAENYATIAQEIGNDPGVHFLDLSADFPPSMFFDALDHLTAEGLTWVGTRLLEEVERQQNAGLLE